MAKRKTRKQKVKSSQRKSQTPSAAKTKNHTKTKPKLEQGSFVESEKNEVLNLLNYDGKLILGDLFKTIIFSAIIIGFQFGLYLYFR